MKKYEFIKRQIDSAGDLPTHSELIKRGLAQAKIKVIKLGASCKLSDVEEIKSALKMRKILDRKNGLSCK